MIRINQKTKRNPSAFLKSTHEILENPIYHQIIQWDENDGFVIKNQFRFENEILPTYFKHQKYTSFVRQLNMYGFHKHRTAKNQNYFKHDQFKKGNLQLTEIRRKPQNKKKGSKLISQVSLQKEQFGNNQEIQENSLKIQKPGDMQQQEQMYLLNEDHESIQQKQVSSQQDDCARLCELLIKQNKILVRRQQQFRNAIIHYKKLSIFFEKNSIQTLQKLCQLNEKQNKNNSPCTTKTSILSQSVRRLCQCQRQEIDYLCLMNQDVMSDIKQLNNTNCFMISSTSIEGGYSTVKIQDKIIPN